MVIACSMSAAAQFLSCEPMARAPHLKTPAEQSVIIGFAVLSLESAMEHLSNRGLQPDSEVGTYGNSRWVYYSDPEGNRFELKETLDAALT